MNYAYRRMLAHQAKRDALSVATDIVRAIACAIATLAIVWAFVAFAFSL